MPQANKKKITYHPKPDEAGNPVPIHKPHKPSMDGFLDPAQIVTITPGAKLPVASLNGIRFASWQPPADAIGWRKVDGQITIEDEPEPAPLKKGQKFATGLVIIEPDERVWMVSPTNQFGGYTNTFPKGVSEKNPKSSFQSNAIREAWEETGIKARIVGYLGDVDRTTTRTRYYLAVREGGTPAEMGWESQAVHLVPLKVARAFLDSQYDHQVVDLVERFLALHDGQLPDAWATFAQRSSTNATRQETPSKDAYVGCLLGGAVGDALGAPVEFMRREEIYRRFGPNGITDYAPAYGGLGRITDDTQLTLFTAEGLLRTFVRGRMRGMASHEDVMANAYRRWLLTQGFADEAHGLKMLDYPGWLFTQRALHSRRAPGNTCIEALRQGGSPENPARNDSKGCGAVMRMAPVGLCLARQKYDCFSQSFAWGIDFAALTHGHPTAQIAAGAFAALIYLLAQGATLSEALARTKTELIEHPRHEETLAALEKAQRLAESDIEPDRAIASLGEGWVAEEALAIAVYCALVAQDFEHGVLLAVNHDGDSDSTGSITGNLLGLMYGVQAIPERWLAPLELRDVITEIAEDLYDYESWPIGEYVPWTPEGIYLFAKYPGN